MKMSLRLTAVAVTLLLLNNHGIGLIESVQSDPAIQLGHWQAKAAKALAAMITKNANQSDYAVFDMDNTSYRYNLEESLLPVLENQGILTRDTLDPSLRLTPFKDTENFRVAIQLLLLPLLHPQLHLLPHKSGPASHFKI
jgi:hypothetical protein